MKCVIRIKIILFFFILFIFSFRSHAQQHTFDSLRKYSYLIAVYKDSLELWHLQGITTGFFIKEEGQLYLLSAYHTFTQTNSISAKPKEEMILDAMRVRIIDDESNKVGFLNIALRKIKERGKSLSFYISPDIYVYKITQDFMNVPIHSIENIIKENRDKTGTTVKAISFGFPTLKKEEKISLETYKDSFYVGQIASPSDYTQIAENKGIDILNVILKPASFNGMSGSPLFYEYTKTTNGKKEEWVEFGGAMVASNPTYNYAAAVKREFVLETFRKAKSLKYNIVGLLACGVYSLVLLCLSRL